MSKDNQLNDFYKRKKATVDLLNCFLSDFFKHERETLRQAGKLFQLLEKQEEDGHSQIKKSHIFSKSCK